MPEDKTKLLRICYWIGAIADVLAACLMLFPSWGGIFYGIPDFKPSPEYKYAMYLGASLMLGWTVLLLWADRKPVERMGILIITVFPVVAGLALAGLYAVLNNYISFGRMLPTWIFQLVISVLAIYSYRVNKLY